ncbi:MAG TPA: agmatinase family protein [Chitinophagales bacterium]|nr:agmatinase family protein [Chitinophagales bacterium]
MNSKEEKIKRFDPNGVASGKNLYGLPFNEEESDIIVLPVPWEVTVSYSAGTARAPKAILETSKQVDLYDADVEDAWKRGIFMKKIDKDILKQSKSLRKKVVKYLKWFEAGASEIDKGKQILDEINASGKSLRNWVKQKMLYIISKKKLPVLLAGDHSTPLGFMEALAQHNPQFGILQIDAHCDLRNAYEGFEFSHASIMFNALKISQVEKLVQVGIRDYCQEEMDVIQNSNGRVRTFFDAEMKRKMFEGETWSSLCDKIVSELPQHIYISFDIDGLDPKLCPHTGTPVPGGLEFEQAIYLIKSVVDSGRKIIGCDLNEVSPGDDEWDANVGARLLYKMCNLMGKSWNRET